MSKEHHMIYQKLSHYITKANDIQSLPATHMPNSERSTKCTSYR